MTTYLFAWQCDNAGAYPTVDRTFRGLVIGRTVSDLLDVLKCRSRVVVAPNLNGLSSPAFSGCWVGITGELAISSL